MKRSGRIIIVCIIAAVFVGCSAAGGKGRPGQMDFNAEMEWKAPDPAAGKRPRILFVGNSYTFYNNLTRMFLNIVMSQGEQSDVYELSQGYYTLEQFANLEDKGGNMLDQTLAKQKWDFVILQESSTIAASENAEEEMYPYARILDEKARASGAQTALLMTWAPKNGIKSGMKRQNMEDMQTILAENYIELSRELDSLLIPAGVGFMRCASMYPEIELWDSDGKHPSPAGSYLTACITYAVLFQRSPENCSYTGDLEGDLALKLQQVAAEVVLN